MSELRNLLLMEDTVLSFFSTADAPGVFAMATTPGY